MIKVKFNLLQILALNSLNVTKENAPINWHFVCHFTWIYENFKEKYFKSIQSTSWLLENLESDSYDKNDMKQKVNDLVRLYKAMQEKWKTGSHSEQIQILTLLHDKWSRMYCSEYFKTSCIGLNLVLQYRKNFLIRNSTDMKMMINLITVSGTLRIKQYWQPLQPSKKNTKRLWLMLLMV